MNRLKRVLLLAALLALPAAQAQTANNGAEEFSVELDSLIAQHQYARAEQIVRQRLTGGYDPALTYFQIGKAYFDHEAWQRSAEFLEKSLKVRGMNDEAHHLLGLDWRELHRPDDAEAELLEAAKENPSSKVNAYFAGHQLLLNGKFEAALPYLYRALDAKPLQTQALQALAFAQARLGNYGLAESYYRKAIDSAPASDDTHYSALVNLSILLLLGHDTARLEEGLSCAQRAEALQPDSPDAHFLAGKALVKLGRLREASPELARAAKLNPEDSKPHFLLARIYDQLGQHDRAQQERRNIARIQSRPGQAGMATVDPVPVAPK
ncbi:MAG TPA: tetratricopeptide repeat protein [Bryobacteraceae bacterium]|nr:tetratricopeptide repeat protein [Bryobacteraceae bacterium]